MLLCLAALGATLLLAQHPDRPVRRPASKLRATGILELAAKDQAHRVRDVHRQENVLVQRGPEGPFAFVINSNQTADVRQLKLVPKLQDQVEQPEIVVEEGLRPGEQVVVDGQYKLQRGSRVKLAEAPGKAKSGGRQVEETPPAEGRKQAAS